MMVSFILKVRGDLDSVSLTLRRYIAGLTAALNTTTQIQEVPSGLQMLCSLVEVDGEFSLLP